MFLILNTTAKLRCVHGGGTVQLGPGAKSFLVDGKPALRAVDVQDRPVQGCPYCKRVLSVQLGQEECLVIERSPALTELAFGTTNAGAWAVMRTADWSAQVGLTVDLSVNLPPPEKRREKQSPAPAREKQPAELSAPLGLHEWRAYLCPRPEPNSFEPNPRPLDACGREGREDQPLASRWLYVFVADRRDRLSLLREYAVASDGAVQEVKSGLRREARPAPPQLGAAGPLRLPLQMNGGTARYAFLASRIRLTRQALGRFAGCPELRPVELTAATASITATDPLTVGQELAKRYVSARDLVVEYTTPAPLTGAQAAGPLPQKVLLARLLQQLFGSDDRFDLKNELRDDGSAVRRFLDEYAREVERLVSSGNRAAEQLCRWLRGSLWQAAAEAYRTFGEEDFDQLLTVFAFCVERLPETRPGRAYLTELLDDRRHFIQEFVLPSSAAPDNVFQVARQTPEAVVGLWKALGIVALDRRRTFTASRYVAGLRFVLRLEGVIDVGTGTLFLRLRRRAVPFEYIEMAEEKGPLTRAAHWVNQHPAGPALKHRLQGALEIINVGLALRKVLSDDGESDVKKLLGLCGAVLDALKEFYGTTQSLAARSGSGLLRHWGGPRVKPGLGALSAVLDIVGGVWDAVDSLQSNDPTAALGAGLTAAGASMLLAGEVAALSGGSLLGIGAGAWTGVGAVVVLIGWGVYALLQKSELERFARSCEWGVGPSALGRLVAEGSKRPKWATRPFRDWQGQPGLQLEALCRLLGAFRVRATDYNTVRIELGSLLLPTSRLEIEFDCRYNLGIRHRPGFGIDWDSGRAQALAGHDEADLTQVRKHDGGDRWIEVEATWPAGKRPERAVQHQGTTCRVRLDVFGNGGLFLPGQTAWLDFVVYPGVGSPIALDSVSSLDTDCLPGVP